MRYRVRYERDDGATWIVTIPAIPGCHSYGRTLEQARERIREAVALWVEDSDRVTLVDDVRIPPGARQKVRRARTARERAEAQHASAQAALSGAARELTRSLGLSLRDAGEILGVSRQRVQQLLQTSVQRRRRGARA